MPKFAVEYLDENGDEVEATTIEADNLYDALKALSHPQTHPLPEDATACHVDELVP